MDSQILQWIGYFASGIIALSMTMNSILKFRWVNIVGAFSFATYGFLIGAFPVMLLNSIIVLVDIYYLHKIYTKKNLFDTIEVNTSSKYLYKFLDFYKNDINRFFPDFDYNPSLNTVSFYVLRNMTVAGLFLAHREGENTLKVGLDYSIPEYRDYKNGKYLYESLKESFRKEGYTRIVAEPSSEIHNKYLIKFGFKKDSEGFLVKEF
jgi:hypothetical protein